jgi:multisubunit Na+/H+ antiporter MnhG subunit
MENLSQYLPFLIPIFALQLILLAVALTNLLRNKQVKCLNVFAWVLIIVFINIIGPVLYFTIGRKED